MILSVLCANIDYGDLQFIHPEYSEFLFHSSLLPRNVGASNQMESCPVCPSVDSGLMINIIYIVIILTHSLVSRSHPR